MTFKLKATHLYSLHVGLCFVYSGLPYLISTLDSNYCELVYQSIDGEIKYIKDFLRKSVEDKIKEHKYQVVNIRTINKEKLKEYYYEHLQPKVEN